MKLAYATTHDQEQAQQQQQQQQQQQHQHQHQHQHQQHQEAAEVMQGAGSEDQDEEWRGDNRAFEAWTRRELYGRRKQNGAMQAVKSRIMHGASFALGLSLVLLLLAVRADYRYGNVGPFRRASTGATLPNLLYAKALWSLCIAGLGLYLWFRKHLLRLDAVSAYAVLRLVDGTIALWLLLALVKDFGHSPFRRDSGLRSGERTIYFVSGGIAAFTVVNTVINLRRLRFEWSQFRLRAFKQYRQEMLGHDMDGKGGFAGDYVHAEVVAPPLGHHMHHRLVDAAATAAQWQQQQQGKSDGPSDHVDLDLSGAAYAMEPYYPQQGGAFEGYAAGFAAGMAAASVGSGSGSFDYGAVATEQQAMPPIEYFEERTQQILTARANAVAYPAIDMFATITYDEYLMRWEGMAESGHFERQISRVPTIKEMEDHLRPKGFSTVHSDVVESDGALLTRIYAFAQSQGDVFLVEFRLDAQNMCIHATFKSQDEEKTHSFISLLELHRVLSSW